MIWNHELNTIALGKNLKTRPHSKTFLQWFSKTNVWTQPQGNQPHPKTQGTQRPHSSPLTPLQELHVQ